MTNILGKRYKCEVCGTEALNVKNGDGTVVCCGQEMALITPRPLTSSD